MSARWAGRSLAEVALLVVVAAAAALALAVAAEVAPGTVEETITIPGFGKVPVYRPEPAARARGVVLFISGDGGWNLGVVDMARRLAGKAVVVGISMPAWQKSAEKDPNRCWYPAGELEPTAQAVQKIYRFPRYLRPILVGYSSGATVVYGALAQSPADTFAGAISLGFCPDLEARRPLCAHGAWKPAYDERKGRSLLPARPDLSPRPDGAPRWTLLQGDIDQVCDPASTAAFASRIPAARLISLPKVGHGFSVPRNWGAAFDEAVAVLLEPPSAADAKHAARAIAPTSAGGVHARLEALGLPLEIQWPERASAAIIFVSGDGGWAEIDQSVTDRLVASGVAVIGWNTLRYFWEPKTIEAFRADLARVVEALPEEVKVFAGGYSFGAEVIPIALAPSSGGRSGPLARVAGMALLAPGPYASLEVSPLDWLRSSERPTLLPVRAALGEEGGLRVLCIRTASESDSGCPEAPRTGQETVSLPGGHHFSGNYEGIAERILSFLEKDGDALGAAPVRP